jgi:molybdate transport system ATP-binding protein
MDTARGDAVNGRSGLCAELYLRQGTFTLDVGFDVEPGETLVLLGPNGSGKTTSLELVAGLRRLERGRIALGETVFAETEHGVDRAPEARRVGLLSQQDALVPHHTVGENVAYGPRARRMPREEAHRVTEEWLGRLELAAFRDRSVEGLSGGQRQRVALARALASGARVLLLDEPFASLDTTARGEIRAELRRFLADVGIPALLVTHEPMDAFVLGDRVAVIEAGRLVQEGAPQELLSHPRSPFVADLVDLNFYRAELTAGAGLKEARVGGAVFHVLADAMAGPVHIVFSPSAVALSPRPPTGSFQNAFRAVVRETWPLPARVRVLLDAGFPIAADVTREAAQRLQLAPGAAQWAMVKATAIRVFP